MILCHPARPVIPALPPQQPEPEKTFKPIAPEPTEDEAISDLLYAGTGPAPPAPASPEAAGPLFEFHTVPAARDSREPSPKAPEPEEDLQPASTIPAPQAKQRTRYFVIKSYSAEVWGGKTLTVEGDDEKAHVPCVCWVPAP